MIDKEAYPLAWPDGWQRTRPQDRRTMRSWRKTANQYREALITELERLKSPTSVISSNVPVTMRGGLAVGGIEPPDCGVAIYFSRPKKEDFSWQDALNLHHPAPSEPEITDAFRRLAQQYHPDRGGDPATFQVLVRHRDNALRWVRQKTQQSFDYAIACDAFAEVRLNLAAIVNTIRAIRQIERCGTSTLLERAFKGFAALPENASPDSHMAGVR